MASGRRVEGAIRSLVNVRGLQLECARVLQETLLIPLLMYDSKTIIWKEKEKSRIGAVLMYNLKALLGIKKMDKVLTAQMRKL